MRAYGKVIKNVHYVGDEIWTDRMKILKVPDQRLERKCEKVTKINSTVKNNVGKLLSALKSIDRWYFPVNGLAANQIGLKERIVVMKTGKKFMTMINPEIVSSSIPCLSIEICASIPGKVKLKRRKLIIKIKYQDLNNRICHKTFLALSAFTMQQEIDHLNGKLIVS